MLVESSFEIIDSLLSQLEKQGYSLGYQSSIDNVHLSFVKERVHDLIKNKSLQKQVTQLKRPLINTKTERLIRRSLRLKAQDKIRDLDIQALCLSAFLTPLRQSVGSCFCNSSGYFSSTRAALSFLSGLRRSFEYRTFKKNFFLAKSFLFL